MHPAPEDVVDEGEETLDDLAQVLLLRHIRQDNDREFFAHVKLSLVLHISHVHLLRLDDSAVFVLLAELLEFENVGPGYATKFFSKVDLELAAVDHKCLTTAHR